MVELGESPPPAAPEPPRRNALLLVIVALVSLVAGAVGGFAGGTVASRVSPTAAPPVVGGLPLPGPSQITVQESSAVIDAVKEVLPAVVTVVVKLPTGGSQSGSGVMIDKARGYVVTNSHVVEEARSTRPARDIQLVLVDGTKLNATVVGNDPFTDVAVLKVDGPLPAQATLGDPARTPLGAQAIAIGSPVGIFQNTVTAGIVSAKNRRFPRPDLRDIFLEDLLQTDAAINPGNSGGPLVWVSTKQVIGLNTLVFRQEGEEGLGFAISASTVRRIADELIATGKVERAFLGISYDDNNPRFAAQQRLPTSKGSVVLEVVANGPAAKAGLRPGDVITKVNGQEIDDTHPLRTFQLSWRPGDRITLTFLRQGQERNVEVTVATLAP